MLLSRTARTTGLPLKHLLGSSFNNISKNSRVPNKMNGAALSTAVKDGMTRVLFCGLQFPTSFNYTKQFLESEPNVEVVAMAHEEVPDKIETFDVCVVRMMKIDSNVIAQAARGNRLKILMQFGVGIEGVDIEAATQAGIKVARIPGKDTGNSLSCAEHAIYLILSLLRDQKAMDKSVQEMRVGAPSGETLFGKTVLIVGYGNIGKELALRLRPFGVRVLATKRSWKLAVDDDLVDEKATVDQLPGFASKADIVVLCCSQTPETAGMINSEFLSHMKKGAYLINVARGGLLEYNAVRNALETNHLGGIGTDVAWVEPFDSTDPILQHPKFIMTPHVAGVTEFSYRNMAKVVANVALKIRAGVEVSCIEGIECVN